MVCSLVSLALTLMTFSPVASVYQDDVDVGALVRAYEEVKASLSETPQPERLASLKDQVEEIFQDVEFGTLDLDVLAELLDGFVMLYVPREQMEDVLVRLGEIAGDERMTELDRAVAAALGVSLNMGGAFSSTYRVPDWATDLQESIQAHFHASPARFDVLRGTTQRVPFRRSFVAMVYPAGNSVLPSSCVTDLMEAIGDDFPVERINEIRDFWEQAKDLAEREQDPLSLDNRERARLFVIAWAKASAAHYQRLADSGQEPERNQDHSDYLLSLVDIFNSPAARGTLIGSPVPEIPLRWASDNSVTSLSDLQGKVVVLDFFATWCGPCITSIPHIRELTERYPKDAVAYVMITSPQGAVYNLEQRPIDCEGDVEKEIALMPRFMERHDITWMVAMMGEGHEVRHPEFDIYGIPHVAILDAQGRVRYNGLHPMDEGQTEKIDGLLREAGIAVPGE